MEVWSPKAELTLSVGERTDLGRLVNRLKTAQGLALRARIIPAGASGASNRAVAEQVGVTQHAIPLRRRIDSNSAARMG